MTEFAHQTRSRDAARAADGGWKPGFAWLLEMGLGKTYVDIAETREMHAAGHVQRQLVYAPKGVYRNWSEREFPQWWPDASVMVWRSGAGKAERARLEQHLLNQNNEKCVILIMNTECMSTSDDAEDFAFRFITAAPCKVTLDESTFIKNPSAARTKTLVALSGLARVRRILTGAPVTRSPLDLYSQFEFLQTRALGFSSYFSFKARYAVTRRMVFGGRKVQVVVGYRELDDLSERIKPLSFRATKDECLDLPPKIYERRDVELSPEQRRAYDEVKKNATTMLEGGQHVTTTEVITQILRLQQILCGHVTDELGVVHLLANRRVEALTQTIAETDGKVIIWSRFRADIPGIVAALAREYGEGSVVPYHGGTAPEDREVSSTRFQTDPTCRFIVSTEQTGGYGNTWTAASLVVYYSTSYDWERRAQSEDRAHRVGQTKSVTYVDLVCPGTVEEKILAALRKKIDIATLITGDAYREWLI